MVELTNDIDDLCAARCLKAAVVVVVQMNHHLLRARVFGARDGDDVFESVNTADFVFRERDEVLWRDHKHSVIRPVVGIYFLNFVRKQNGLRSLLPNLLEQLQ